MAQTFPYEVLLDNVRSAYNVGAIFRTCDGAGVRKLHLCGFTPYPPHDRIPKTALGAIDTVFWQHHTSTIEFLKEKKGSVPIIGIENTENAVYFQDYTPKPDSIIIFGHEGEGLSQEVLGLCDEVIKIPMYGTKESLNVATCAGIITYHFSNYFAKNG